MGTELEKEKIFKTELIFYLISLLLSLKPQILGRSQQAVSGCEPDSFKADLNKRLEDREIEVRLTPQAKDFVIDNAYDPIYGARPLKRYIQKNVETLSAKLILEDRVQPHETIEFSVEGDELTARAVKG